MTRPPRPITVHYFAVLRDQCGLDSETVQTQAETPASLYDELSERHGFTLPSSSLKVAVNDDFAAWSQALDPGDTVVFIPPVAGG